MDFIGAATSLVREACSEMAEREIADEYDRSPLKQIFQSWQLDARSRIRRPMPEWVSHRELPGRRILHVVLSAERVAFLGRYLKAVPAMDGAAAWPG